MDRLFPRDLYGRLALGLASLVLFPVGAFGAGALMLGRAPGNVQEWLIFAIAEELFVAWTVFFGCGLIWAVATPRWLENCLESVAKRLSMALALVMVPFGLLVLWTLILMARFHL
jgi:hypothetical protein